jgi:4-diphosphocytidyl-2-C-methyl-D-erythritol kinase
MIRFAAKKIMIVFPNCKINIGLNIISRRTDGYHNLQTCFYPLTLSDCLEIIPSPDGKNSFTSTGIKIPDNGQPNLCQRAAQLMQEKYGIPSVHIHLHKVIPIGSGLGGGSADAAYTLLLLSQLFELNLTQQQLLDMAASLGSDCAFFIINKPSIATGRGEILMPANISLKGYYLLLVIPPIHISTAEAFSGIHPTSPKHSISELLPKDIGIWKDTMTNDFETGIFKSHPAIAQIKNTLYKQGALYASMSGSGSSVFGIFTTPPPENIFPGCFVWREEPETI